MFRGMRCVPFVRKTRKRPLVEGRGFWARGEASSVQKKCRPEKRKEVFSGVQNGGERTGGVKRTGPGEGSCQGGARAGRLLKKRPLGKNIGELD